MYKRYNKFGNKKCVYKGLKFDSKGECGRYKELETAKQNLSIYNYRKKNANDVNHIAHWHSITLKRLATNHPLIPNFTWSHDLKKLIEEKQWKHYDLDYEFIIKEEDVDIDFFSDSNSFYFHKLIYGDNFYILNNKKYWTYYNRVMEEGKFNNEGRLVKGKLFDSSGNILEEGEFDFDEKNKYRLKNGYMLTIDDEKIYFENFNRVSL